MNQPSTRQPPEGRRVYSPSRLNREVRLHLESAFGAVWIEGEISNLYRARSGHSYFVLKDAQAQVKCALFRQRNPYGQLQLSDGQQVLVRGRLSLYEPRGEYQLIADHVEDAGEGQLRREFEWLKQQLAAEGLFATERKRALPAFPRRIAAVTSPDGAAIRDVISVIARRYPAVRLTIVPTRVQGAGAEGEIRKALARAIAIAPDVVLVTRGGGSLEDLWAFNDERLARDIVAAPIPVVCAVGHEVDTCIAEFAADVRAATPSAAAELLVPDGAALRQRLARLSAALDRQDPRRSGERSEQRVDELQRRLARVTNGHVDRLAERLTAAGYRLRAQHPARRLDETRGRARVLDDRLRSALARRLAEAGEQQRALGIRLAAVAPRPGDLEARQRHVGDLRARLATAMRAAQSRFSEQARAADGRLRALSPAAVLQRGYSMTRVDGTGEILRSKDQARPGDRLTTRVADGEISSEVVDDG